MCVRSRSSRKPSLAGASEGSWREKQQQQKNPTNPQTTTGLGTWASSQTAPLLPHWTQALLRGRGGGGVNELCIINLDGENKVDWHVHTLSHSVRNAKVPNQRCFSLSLERYHWDLQCLLLPGKVHACGVASNLRRYLSGPSFYKCSYKDLRWGNAQSRTAWMRWS